MSKPKAPTPPDPLKTVQAQTDQGLGTSIANSAMGMVGQRGPDGSLSYNQTGSQTVNIGGKSYDIPTYEAVTSLSDTAQKRYDTTSAAEQNLADAAKVLSGQISSTSTKPISYDGLPELAGSGGYEGSRKSVEDALYSRLQPQMDRARAQRETDLANRGIRPGSAAYDRAMSTLGETENDARMQTVLAGGQEQSRLAGLDSATRAQLLQERTAAANEPISRLSALLSQSQVNTPQYQTYTPQGMPTTDVQGAINTGYAQQQDAWKQKMQAQQGLYGGLFGLGSSAIMATNPLGMFGLGAAAASK